MTNRIIEFNDSFTSTTPPSGGADGVAKWTTPYSYIVDDVVLNGNDFYICLTDHTSSVFVTDLAALKWGIVSKGVLDHTALTNIGTNTHANIDSHIASTLNPHSVTKTQVGLSDVPNIDATVAANITQDSTHRFTNDTDVTRLANTSGTNTGDQANIAGNASTVTTNANLTGKITSVGNATSLGSFTSLELKTALTDETGSGPVVFSTSPVLTFPTIDTPTRLDMKKGTLAFLTTYAASATDGQLVFATDTLETYVVKNFALSAVGSGTSSGSGINYILSADAENGLGSWATYKNGIGATTPDGTIIGTANSTFAVSTSTALRGTANFLFTKNSGASRIGEGVYYPFTIDNSDKGKVLNCSFDYQISSGTFVDDAMEFFIWDVTNSRLIQPAPSKLKNSGIIEKFAFEFQTSIDSTSYRLFIHVGVVTDSANTVRFDNFNLGPQAKLYGSAITDWVAYTPIAQNTTIGTGGITSGAWRRIGDSIEIKAKVTLGTGGVFTGIAGLTIPSFVTVDQLKLISSNDTPYGSATLLDSSAQVYFTATSEYSVGRTQIECSSSVGGGSVNATVPWTWAVGDTMELHISGLPILGWSSSQIFSSDADTRVVAASITGTPTGTISNSPTNAIFPTVTKDTHGAYSTSTGLYTVQVSGFYRISNTLSITSTLSSVNFAVGPQICKNNATTIGWQLFRALATAASITHVQNVTAQNYFNVGETISVRGYSDGSANSYAALINTFNIERISGPSQIAASESVSASYWLSANFTSSTTIPINFDSKEFDSHNSVTTSATAWKFTAPMSGVYSIGATSFPSTTAYYNVYKNGTLYKALGYSLNTGVMSSTILIKLLAGEYMDLRTNVSSMQGGGSLGQSGVGNINITRVGN